VSGQRVFVQTADRTLGAWDGLSGRRLWSQSRTADNLALKRPGVLLAVGDTLVAGAGGRLVGVNPANGSARWEVPVAAPRGTNDVERLVDLTGPASRMGDVVCARAYQATVGCVDTAKAVLRWSRSSVGAEGLGGDAQRVYGTEANGDVAAWRRDDGEPAWASQRLRYRALTAPLAFGRMLVIGEDTGTLHFMSSEDGTLLGRVSPDGSGIAAPPVRAGRTVVVVTRSGGVFGYSVDADAGAGTE
jgi:outer membrane protein assembly factor BamB